MSIFRSRAPNNHSNGWMMWCVSLLLVAISVQGRLQVSDNESSSSIKLIPDANSPSTTKLDTSSFNKDGGLLKNAITSVLEDSTKKDWRGEKHMLVRRVFRPRNRQRGRRLRAKPEETSSTINGEKLPGKPEINNVKTGKYQKKTTKSKDDVKTNEKAIQPKVLHSDNPSKIEKPNIPTEPGLRETKPYKYLKEGISIGKELSEDSLIQGGVKLIKDAIAPPDKDDLSTEKPQLLEEKSKELKLNTNEDVASRSLTESQDVPPDSNTQAKPQYRSHGKKSNENLDSDRQPSPIVNSNNNDYRSNAQNVDPYNKRHNIKKSDDNLVCNKIDRESRRLTEASAPFFIRKEIALQPAWIFLRFLQFAKSVDFVHYKMNPNMAYMRPPAIVLLDKEMVKRRGWPELAAVEEVGDTSLCISFYNATNFLVQKKIPRKFVVAAIHD